MPTDPDQQRAAREHSACQRLLHAGASGLPRAPWLHPAQPPYSTDLVRFAVWRSQSGTLADDEVEAALALIPAARAEMDQLETGMLFAARAQGLSWARIAREMGLGSAQAALQRYDRLTGRVESRSES
ncbi:MAG TPA: hypothetical protein VFZ85_19020 [Jiangellaceae bacterium]